jgi:UDP-3-O-[3-hydroxymyristoyl] glucosamine N-acyltransferase
VFKRIKYKKMELRLKDIARILDGTIDGDEDTVISNISGIEDAKEGDITFVANPKYIKYIEKTNASAIVCSPGISSESKNLLKVKNPYLAYAKAITFLNPPREETGTVDERAFIGKDVKLGENVTIYPFSFIGDGSTIGDNTTIYPNCFLGRKVKIGSNTFLHPNVTIREECIVGNNVIINSGAIIGSDGFGFAPDGAKKFKIPQLGIVQIDDDVEIGACTAIDRATMGKTWIKRGAKLDNLIQVAHNCTIGEDSIIIAHTGISGSTHIGDRVTMAGQSATAGHVKIGNDVTVGARGGVAVDVPPGQTVSGAPHMPHRDWLRSTLIFRKLPEMNQTIKELKKKITELESKIK